MAQIITKISQAKVINSLDTYNHTATTTNMYTVAIMMTEIPPSGISIAIQKNGVTQATSTAPAATQNEIQMRLVMNLVPTDLISVVITSSDDKNMNTIKGILNIHTGAV